MKKIIMAASALALVASATGVYAAGFEKGIAWSGKHAGLAGAAVSTTSGAEALYFNPAGLTRGTGIDATLQFSPTIVSIKGPVATTDAIVEGKRQTIPFAAVLGSWGLNDRTSVGLGVYAAGGLRAAYEGIGYEAVPGFTGTAQSRLTMIEASLGGAYRVTPDLKVGASWRAAFVSGAFSGVQLNKISLSAINAALAGNTVSVATTAGLRDLTAQNYAGFRVGAQYAPSEGIWGVGLNVRTPVSLKLKGTTFATSQAFFDAGGALAAGETAIEATNANNVATDATGGAGTAESTFPWQVALGGHVDLLDRKLRVHAGYTWTNYATVKSIPVSGSFTTGAVISDQQVATLNAASAGLGGTLGTAVAAQVNNQQREVPDYDTAWKNEHLFRLAAEYLAVENWVFRAGYGVAGSIIPADKGRATFSAPGTGHTLGLGAGTAFLDENRLGVDVALEYSWANGTITASDANGNVGGAQNTRAIGIHTGVSYLF